MMINKRCNKLLSDFVILSIFSSDISLDFDESISATITLGIVFS